MGSEWSKAEIVSWWKHYEVNHHPALSRPIAGYILQASDVKVALTRRQPSFITLSTFIFVCLNLLVSILL